MIQPIGYIDASAFTAYYLIKYKAVSILRTEDGDAAVLKEWKSARALLTRIKNRAAELRGSPVHLGKAWIETLDPHSGNAWATDPVDYAAEFMRLRIALITAPGCWSFCGAASAQLQVGQVNAFDNRLLSSEVNFSEHPRVHLIVDIDRPHAE